MESVQWLRRKGKLERSGELPSRIKIVHMQILRNGLWVHPAGRICYRYKDAVRIIEEAKEKNQLAYMGYRLIPGVETISVSRKLAEAMPDDDTIDRIERDIMHLAIMQPSERWTVGAFMAMLKGVSQPGIRKAVQNLLADRSLIKIGQSMHPWPVIPRHRKRKKRSKLSERTRRYKSLNKEK
jgi:hypothetical protein